MRFLSKFGRFGVQIRAQNQEPYANGMVRVIDQQVAAIFQPTGLTTSERELAFKSFAFNGSLQEMDEVTIVQPDYRIGVYDTVEQQLAQGWSDELRKEVEQKLLAHANLYGDVVMVPVIEIPPPWPRYDEYGGSPSQLARKLVDEGYNLDDVIAYEREHQNRERVLEAIALACDEVVEAEEELVG
jgi:hypothetical protein